MPLSMTRRRVSFEVPGLARAQGNAKAVVPRKWAEDAHRAGTTPRAVVTLDDKPSKDWQALVASQAQDCAGDGLFVGAVVLTVTFRLPRPVSAPRRVIHHLTKPDLDKLTRNVLDALTGVLYADDKQVVDLHARKRYVFAPHPPSAHITLEEADLPDLAQPDLLADGSLFV